MSIEISTSTTSTLDDDEVEELESLVAQAYGVDNSEVTSITEYVTTGSLVVTILDDISNQDAINEITSALASSLGVGEDSITLSLDLESGEVSYTVTTPNYDDTADILDALKSDDIVNLLMEMSDAVEITSVATNAEIIAQVDIIVNGDNVTVPLQQAENIFDALLDNQYESNIQANYVTSSPSSSPSLIPTTRPTSILPTNAPSITGSIVFVEMNTIVTASLTDEELADIINAAEEAFGVFPGSVEADVSYDITGSIPFPSDGEYVEEELIAALQSSLATTLNIHVSDVIVDMDPETGVAIYTISSNSADGANDLQEVLQLASTSDQISSLVSSVLPEVSNVNYFIFDTLVP